MRRITSIILIFLLCFGFVGCSKTYHGIDELIEKAREEFPISNADTVDIQYAGMCGEDNKALAWFISGNEYQAHHYLPMEIEIKGNGANYTFIHTYKPITDRVKDIAIVNWNRGYAFLINNPEVATVSITLENGEVIEEVIQKDTIPYVFYVSSIPSEYVFLNINGVEVN